VLQHLPLWLNFTIIAYLLVCLFHWHSVQFKRNIWLYITFHIR